MVTQKQFKEHYLNLYNGKAVYVWGANGEIITKELIDKLYSWYGSKTYNREYYDNKLAEGQGRIGADCSGSIYPLSGADNTAKGYYNACPVKGKIANLPKGTACLVFNAKFTHVGAYMGDGTTIEMRSSAMNVYKENFDESRWAYFGIPVWLETETEVANDPDPAVPAIPAEKPVVSDGDPVIRYIQKWCNDNYSTGIVEDGKLGPETKKAVVKALQQYLNNTYGAGLVVDGVFGSKTKAACHTVKNGKSDLAFIAQALLYIRGYDMSHSGSESGKLDGNWGSGCANTVLQFQRDTKGLRHDGLCGPASFQALCKW